MNEIIEFIKDCDCFFVTTISNNIPQIRPFGAIMEYQSKLYICTNSKKKVYSQILKSNNICIGAIKRNSRSWIRFYAKAELNESLQIKKEFFVKCPRLKEIYGSYENDVFKVFKLEINKLEKY